MSKFTFDQLMEDLSIANDMAEEFGYARGENPDEMVVEHYNVVTGEVEDTTIVKVAIGGEPAESVFDANMDQVFFPTRALHKAVEAIEAIIQAGDYNTEELAVAAFKAFIDDSFKQTFGVKHEHAGVQTRDDEDDLLFATESDTREYFEDYPNAKFIVQLRGPWISIDEGIVLDDLER